MRLVLLATLLLAPPAWAGKYFDQKEPVEYLQPTPSDAVVYILRTTRMGGLIHFWTFDSETLVGVTHGKSWNVVRMAPGTHLLWAKAENVAVLPLNLHAGETYFVHQQVLPGFGKARTQLELVDRAQGEEWLREIKRQLVVTPEAIEKGREIANRLLELARRRGKGSIDDEGTEDTSEEER
jgi:hypothetical protein